jgi:cytidylate kinase
MFESFQSSTKEMLEMSDIILALSGPRACGKSTIAKHLVNNHGYTRLAFADALREIASVRAISSLMIGIISVVSAPHFEKCGHDSYLMSFHKKSLELKALS